MIPVHSSKQHGTCRWTPDIGNYFPFERGLRAWERVKPFKKAVLTTALVTATAALRTLSPRCSPVPGTWLRAQTL